MSYEIEDKIRIVSKGAKENVTPVTPITPLDELPNNYNDFERENEGNTLATSVTTVTSVIDHKPESKPRPPDNLTQVW